MQNNQADEHEGQGGSYVVDKKTGKRKLVERTKDSTEPQKETPSPAEDEAE